MKHVSDSEVAN